MEEKHIAEEGEEREPRSLFTLLGELPSELAAKLAASPLGRFFGGYGKSRELLEESRAMHTVRTSRAVKRASDFRYRAAHYLAHSRLLSALHHLFTILQQTRLRAYGLFLATFGIYTMLVYAVKLLAFASGAEQSILITGIVLTVLGIPLLFSSMTLHESLEEGRPLGALFHRIVGLRIYARRHDERWQLNGTGAFLLGSVLGVAGFFLHPLYLLGGILGLIVFFLLLYSPEFSLLLALFLAPFLIFFESPSVLLAVIVLIGTVGYIGKLFLGRRSFRLEPADLGILALILCYLFSCFFTRGGTASVKAALLAVVLTAGYFLAANLITTPEMLERVISSLLAGGGLVALIGILQQMTGQAVANWLDSTAYDYISGRITSVLRNPNVLAVYLILLLPFALARTVRGRTAKRISSGIIFAMLLCALVLTWSRGAWIGAILALVVFALLCRPGALYVVIPVGIATPFALRSWLPALADRFSSAASLSDSSVFYRSSLWQGVWSMLGDNFLGGIGMGTEAFAALFPFYAPSGIESAAHAHSLYLQYFVSFGILGPVILLGAVLLVLQCLFTHRTEETDPTLHLLSIASICAILAVLVNGLTDYVFYNYRIFFLFFAVLGISVAITRVGQNESRRRLHEDESGAAAYSLDLNLHG